jgi:hypothetical protein
MVCQGHLVRGIRSLPGMTRTRAGFPGVSCHEHVRTRPCTWLWLEQVFCRHMGFVCIFGRLEFIGPRRFRSGLSHALRSRRSRPQHWVSHWSHLDCGVVQCRLGRLLSPYFVRRFRVSDDVGACCFQFGIDVQGQRRSHALGGWRS